MSAPIVTAEQMRAFREAVKARRESSHVQVTTLGVVVAFEAFGLIPHPYDASKRNRNAEARLQTAILRWSQ